MGNNLTDQRSDNGEASSDLSSFSFLIQKGLRIFLSRSLPLSVSLYVFWVFQNLYGLF